MTYYNDIGKLPPRGGFDYIIMDWTSDSQSIMVRCNRTPYGERKGKYYLVNLKGGLEKPLQIPEGGWATLSPDDNQIAFTIIAREIGMRCRW